MDNSRSLLLTSVVFNILSLATILLQFYSPQTLSSDTYKIALITPPLTPEIERIQDGIKENLTHKNYRLTTYHVESVHNAEDVNTVIDQALYEGARLLIPIGRHVALAAYKATKRSKVPIVFCEVQDPVIEHLVDTPQISGNHVTGTVRTPADYGTFIDGIGIIKPTPQKIVLIHNASTYGEEKEVEDFMDACRVRAIEASCVPIKHDAQIMGKIKEVVEKKPDVIMAFVQGFSDTRLKEIAHVCKKNHILLFCNHIKYAHDTAAISFGIDDYEVGKAVAKIVDTIAQKGIHPTKIPLHLLDDAFRFAVNTKILKQQGISIMPDHLFIMKYGRIIT